MCFIIADRARLVLLCLCHCQPKRLPHRPLRSSRVCSPIRCQPELYHSRHACIQLTSDQPLSSAPSSGLVSRQPLQDQDRDRAQSPSLRTYGTFGKIQSSLDKRGDVLAPAASSTTDKESDLFSNLEASPRSRQEQYQKQHNQHLLPPQPHHPSQHQHHHQQQYQQQGHQVAASQDRQDAIEAVAAPNAGPTDPVWDMGTSLSLAYENSSPTGLGIASGWGDGTFNFSMIPSQSDWVSQSLDFDFGYSGMS
jgi:hypothetical protein